MKSIARCNSSKDKERDMPLPPQPCFQSGAGGGVVARSDSLHNARHTATPRQTSLVTETVGVVAVSLSVWLWKLAMRSELSAQQPLAEVVGAESGCDDSGRQFEFEVRRQLSLSAGGDVWRQSVGRSFGELWFGFESRRELSWRCEGASAE
jgi:hypothetical protein